MYSINGNCKKIIIISLIIISVFFLIINSIESIILKNYIWIEAENADELHNYLSVIDDAEASGKRAIVSATRSHEVNSYAVYNFTINSTGKYQLWARLYGYNACANSYHISIDNSNRFMIGNDDVMRTWHWLKCALFDLTPGNHKLYVWNEENQTRLDKILLTTDYYYIPSDKGESSNFEINFNENIPDFFICSKKEKWERKQYNTDQKIYQHQDNNVLNYFIINKLVPENYYFKSDVIINQISDFDLVVLFNYVDSINYKSLELKNDSLIFLELSNGNAVNKKTDVFNIKGLRGKDSKNKLSIIKEGNFYTFKLNDINVKEMELNQPNNKGFIGLGSYTGDIYYDNILSKSNLYPLMECNFFSGMTGDWKIVEGEWNLIQFPYYYIIGTQKDQKPAFILNGEEFWKNYILNGTFHAEKGGFGMAFNVQNEHNYYLFKWENLQKNANIQLIKVKNDIETVLCKKDRKYDAKEYYKMQVKTVDGLLQTFINDEAIFSCNDSSFLSGKVGIWIKNTENTTSFDDLKIVAYTPTKDSTLTYEYNFNNRLDIYEDLSDWKDITDFITTEADKIFVKKDLFEKKTVYNKKVFNNDINIQVIPVPVVSNTSLIIYLNSILNDNDLAIVFKKYSVLLKQNGNVIENTEIDTQRKNIEIIYKKAGNVSVKLDNVTIIDTSVNSISNKYKVGFGFEGIDMGEIPLPSIKLKTNLN